VGHPEPVWSHNPKRGYVVLKVTPKRIYLKCLDISSSSDYWSKDTGLRLDYPGFGVLDVDSTLKAWEKFQKTNEN